MPIRHDLITQIQAQQLREDSLQFAALTIERLKGDLEPEMQGWSRSGGVDDLPPEISLDPARLREGSRLAFYQKPFGRVIIRNFVKFIIGTGTVIDWEEKDERKLDAIQEWWKTATKSIKWFRFQREYVTRLFRDGETFVRRFDGLENKPLHLRFVEPSMITDDDIITDDSDVQTVLGYRVRIPKKNGSLELQEVDAPFMHHIKNADENMKRGRPILESILPYITKHEKWLEARMVLNQVRSSIAIVQEVQGTTTDLFRIRSQQRASTRGSDTDRAKMLKPGTIIRGTPGVKYNMLSPNIDAKDASEDGRNIQLAMAAGAGFPDSFVTADWSMSNYASSAIAQNPAIREFEDWQSYIVESIAEIVDWILEDGVTKEAIPQDAKLGYAIGFPPLLKRDIQQETAAYHIMWEDGVISIPSWRMKMGLNNDKEQKLIDANGGPPFEKLAKMKKPKLAPKRVDDRNPRQATVTGSGESEQFREEITGTDENGGL